MTPVLIAVVVGVGLWWLTTPAEAFVFGTRDASDSRPRRSWWRAPDDPELLKGTERLLWMAGIPLPAPLLRPIQLITGGVIAVVGLMTTHNPGVAIVLGLMGVAIPPTLLKNLALARWRQADHEAYVMANTLRYVLPVQGHPVTALRQLAGGLHDPLRGWMLGALAQESAGVPVEEALSALAKRLAHAELQLLAEIVRADRREKPAHALLGELLDAWTERIRADQQRAGKLMATKRFATAIIAGPVVGFVLTMALSAHLRGVFTHSLAGAVLGALGMVFMGVGALVVRNVIAQSEEVQF